MVLMLQVLAETFSFPAQQGMAYGFGPAIFPRLVAAGVLLCAIISIVQTLRDKKEESNIKIEFKWADLKRPTLLLGMGIMYVSVIESLGFIVTNLIFLLVMLLAYKNRKTVALAVSLSITAAVYILFKVILKVPLPTGTII